MPTNSISKTKAISSTTSSILTVRSIKITRKYHRQKTITMITSELRSKTALTKLSSWSNHSSSAPLTKKRRRTSEKIPTTTTISNQLQPLQLHSLNPNSRRTGPWTILSFADNDFGNACILRISHPHLARGAYGSFVRGLWKDERWYYTGERWEYLWGNTHPCWGLVQASSNGVGYLFDAERLLKICSVLFLIFLERLALSGMLLS